MGLSSGIKLKLISTYLNLSITPLIIGNGPTLTHFSFRGSQLRAHYKVTFPLSYPLLLGGQQHLWRSDFSEDCQSPMKSLKLAHCRDLNPWSSDHMDYALDNCTTDLQCTRKQNPTQHHEIIYWFEGIHQGILQSWNNAGWSK